MEPFVEFCRGSNLTLSKHLKHVKFWLHHKVMFGLTADLIVEPESSTVIKFY